MSSQLTIQMLVLMCLNYSVEESDYVDDDTTANNNLSNSNNIYNSKNNSRIILIQTQLQLIIVGLETEQQTPRLIASRI